jgi:hypothetical protein
MIKGIIIMNTLKLLEWNTFSSIKIKLEAQVSLYRSPDINKSS